MLVSSAVLFPFVMFSAVRFTNRIAGPMVRFRRTLQQLARGETAPVLEIRGDDFWSDIVNDLNRVSARLCDLSSQVESSHDAHEIDELAEEPSCV
jgi:hypothetical protein